MKTDVYHVRVASKAMGDDNPVTLLRQLPIRTTAQTKPWWHYRPRRQCWPLFRCQEVEEPSGPARGGWASGESTHILRCRVCGTVRGPFIDNSGDAGF